MLLAQNVSYSTGQRQLLQKVSLVLQPGQVLALVGPKVPGKRDLCPVYADGYADDLDSVADGLRLIWPLVADEFEHVWALPDPPSGRG